ncbi:MAG: hypothetical protein II330_00755 [Clostridia bacterium]|nr:hypothetical protein [Clostridia bacterium]
MMFRYRSNKQAFIIAVLVILLCLISLTGATYALFTSGANSGTIGIITTAGDIKVDIVDAADEEQSLVGQVLQFRTSSDSKEILFEPGAAFCTQGFKIKNTGDIPINFRLSVSEDEDIDMEEFYEAFEVWISTNPTDPSDATKLIEFTDRLEVGSSSEDTYYLFIKMKETVGNDFQGKTYTGIGVTVYAVQGNVNVKEQSNEPNS